MQSSAMHANALRGICKLTVFENFKRCGTTPAKPQKAVWESGAKTMEAETNVNLAKCRQHKNSLCFHRIHPRLSCTEFYHIFHHFCGKEFLWDYCGIKEKHAVLILHKHQLLAFIFLILSFPYAVQQQGNTVILQMQVKGHDINHQNSFLILTDASFLNLLWFI